MGKQVGRVDLDEAVRLVVLQFRFTKAEQVPPALGKRLRRDPEVRKGRTSGTLSIQPVQNVSPGGALADLEAMGYELVDAFCKERVDDSNPEWMREYSVAQFVLARRENAFVSEDFKEIRETIRAEFRIISGCAMWRTRAYLNPFYNETGEAVEGASAISINFEERKPYLRPDGKPELVWRRDAKGEKVGAGPLPLKAAHRLRIVSDAPGVLIEAVE